LKSWGAELLFIEFSIERRPTGRPMKAQIIEKHGKKEFAVIPYKDFLRLQEEVEDYHDLRDLRRAKADTKNRQGRPLDLVAATLGLKRKS
jgi:hypothetical protein